MPLYMNPAEFIIQLVNTDFSSPNSTQVLEHLHSAYLSSPSHPTVTSATPLSTPLTTHSHPSPLHTTLTLLHRSFLKSHRDIVAYGIRIAMYVCLAIMMGTVWLRLAPTESNITAFTNAIYFGGAFMSFMAVAYIPSYLEDLALYTKERANGLYGPAAFMIANFVIGVPYLFVISLLFSVIAYWLGNFNPTGQAFGTWVMWLFLDLLAAESLVVLLSSIIPIFVVALAATAFANGLWMCVNGFMVKPGDLNVFWRYVFHYIDYQAYVFRGMMVNEFGNRRYACGEGCVVEGKEVLGLYGYGTGEVRKYVGYLLVIILVYRVLGWAVLWVRKH
jgi:ABC-type multidrug transport system permease subunit